MERGTNKRTVVYNGGIGFCGALALILIVLKLLKLIDLSWVWVLAPLWIPTALVVAGIAIYLLVLGIILIVAKSTHRKRSRELKRWRKTMFGE